MPLLEDTLQATAFFFLVSQTGLEPVASSSAGKRSNPLSYWDALSNQAGREGFEPSRDIATPTHLAGGRTRPYYATSPYSVF